MFFKRKKNLADLAPEGYAQPAGDNLSSVGAAGDQPTLGTSQALKATGIYIDLVSGLKGQVAELRKDKRLWQFVALISLCSLVLAFPLKKRVPYFFEVNSATGQVALSDRVVEELKDTDSSVAYFLRIWVARVMTINGATIKDTLPAAYKWTRGSASNELDDWSENVDRTAVRIAKTPGLTREILGVPTVSFNEDRSVAFVDFVTLERENGIEKPGGRKRRLIALEFATLTTQASRRDAAEEADNPLGITITHFTVQDQVSK